MARVRNSGGATSAWAVVIFAAGFVVCLLLAIIFHSQLSKAEEQANQARADLGRYVTAEEQSAPVVMDLVKHASSNQHVSVISQLMDENRQLKVLLSGDATANVKSLASQAADLKIQTAGMLSEVNRLRGEVTYAKGQVQKAEAAKQEAQQNLLAAQTQSKQLGASYNQSLDQLKQQLASANSQYQAYQQKTDKMSQDLTKQVQQVHQENQKQVVALQNKATSLQHTIAVLKKQLEEVHHVKNATTSVTAPDGEIVSVNSTNSRNPEVYINLGHRDHLVLGMTFEVFTQGNVIRLDRYEDLRGKATIQVIKIDDTTAVARVVRLDRTASLQRGDQIVNLVYDPNTTYTFYVWGNFDIDHTGAATVADAQRIDQMITKWGGKIADDLDYNVDFLVLGQEPQMPKPLPPDVFDPVRLKAYQAAKKAYEDYQTLKAQSKRLHIPVLDQNRFLGLVGYYHR